MGRDIPRREFLKHLLGAAAAAALPPVLPAGEAPSSPPRRRKGGVFYRKEARWYRPLPGNRVQCALCPRGCVVEEGKRGECRVRENAGGVYYTLAWGNPCTVRIDPVEKKPFFHFLPGASALSIAEAGCNMSCKFCQNYEISQVPVEKTANWDLPPEAAAALAGKNSCPIIAFTYSEPVVWSEYVLDTAVEARRSGIHPVTISNGFISPRPLSELLEVLSAVKIDLKALSEDFYRKTCGGELKPVLDTIASVAESGVWLEIVYLVIPTLNDGRKELEDTARWILRNLGPDVPLHFSRFHPEYLLKNIPPTPPETVRTARKAALDIGLHYVYTGNLPGDEGENTFCPSCGKMVIERFGYYTGRVNLKEADPEKQEARCAFCGTPIKGVFA